MTEETNWRIGDYLITKNNQFLAFNKPAGLPSQPDLRGEESLFSLAERYIRHPLHLIHRLDQGASGVMLMAQHEKAAAALNELMRDGLIKRTYLAVVREAPAEPEGVLKHAIVKLAKTNKTVAAPADQDGQQAELHYKTIGKTDFYTLLEINLITGRHHQIRAQLSAIGSPIKGDIKYGFRRGNLDRSIHLHAYRLQFPHPITGEAVDIVAPLPQEPLWQALAEFVS
jgi:23S rRNA pseudouridine1911/1915/1917 synthase